MSSDPDLRDHLMHVEIRLIEGFVPPLRVEEVRQCVAVSAERFATARIQTYVAVLIERGAADLLREQERQRSSVVVPFRQIAGRAVERELSS